MTPDAIARSYDTSIIVRRWLGCWVDFLVLAAIFILPDALLGNAVYQRLLPLWILLAVAYFPITEGMTGRSLGKLATRTIVVNAKGEKPGVLRAFVRTLLRVVEVNPLLLGGIPAGLVAIASKTRRRLGDFAANTYVLKSEHIPLLGSNVESFSDWSARAATHACRGTAAGRGKRRLPGSQQRPGSIGF